MVTASSELQDWWRVAHSAVGVGSCGLSLKPVVGPSSVNGKDVLEGGKGILVTSVISLSVEIKRTWCHAKITYLFYSENTFSPYLLIGLNSELEGFYFWSIVYTQSL